MHGTEQTSLERESGLRALIFKAIAFALLAFFIGIGAARAQTGPRGDVRLRAEIVIAGPDITLGDLFANIDNAAAAIVVSKAPAPGERLTLPATQIAAWAARNGIAWVPAQNQKSIVVERMGRLVPQQEIMRRLASAIERETRGRPVEIDMPGRDLEIYVAGNAAPSVSVEQLNYDPRSGRFSGTLLAPANDPRGERFRIAGRASLIEAVPVLKSRVAPGQAIGAADVEWREMRASALSGDYVARMEEVVGRAPKRMISPGQPIRAFDLGRPEMVAKGAQVTMIVAAPGMTLTAIGKAIDAGAEGEVISVVNLQSNKTVQATVTAPNTVTVPFSGRPVQLSQR